MLRLTSLVELVRLFTFYVTNFWAKSYVYFLVKGSYVLIYLAFSETAAMMCLFTSQLIFVSGFANHPVINSKDVLWHLWIN